VKAALAAHYDDSAWTRMLPPLQPLDAAKQAALRAELAATGDLPVR
jgi:hypothetical protein